MILLCDLDLGWILLVIELVQDIKPRNGLIKFHQSPLCSSQITVSTNGHIHTDAAKNTAPVPW